MYVVFLNQPSYCIEDNITPMLTLKDHVSGSVEFQYYRAGNLMYKTSTGIEFPVPISDTNDATFPRTEKALLFMRWIRKHLQDNGLMGAPKTLKEPREVSKLLAQHSQNKFTP